MSDAVETVLKFRDDNAKDLLAILNVGLWLYNNGQFTDETLRTFETVRDFIDDDPRMLATAALTRIMIRHDDVSRDVAAADAIRAISLDKTSEPAFHSLVLARLLQKRYIEAYAATLAAEKFGVNLAFFHNLTELLVKGVKAIDIKAMGDDYSFMIRTDTPACVHACGQFLSFSLFEREELDYTRTFAEGTRSILEVGTLLGNHTAFYLRTFDLDRITCIEALPPLAEATEWAAKHNLPDGRTCEINVINAWAGRDSGKTEFIDYTIRRARVDDLAEQPVDFIKIDVDGGELDVLEGAERTLTTGAVRLMLETTDQNEEAAHKWLSPARVHALPHDPAQRLRQSLLSSKRVEPSFSGKRPSDFLPLLPERPDRFVLIRFLPTGPFSLPVFLNL